MTDEQDELLDYPTMDEVLCEEDFVRGMARNLAGGNSHDADDLTQELWLAVLEAPPKSRGAMRGWIVRVLSNRTASQYRRRGVRRVDESVDLNLIADRADERDRSLVEEVHGRVESAVDQLPDLYRDVLKLRFFDGLGPAAIAERMGSTLETTRTRLRRGRKLLYAELERRDLTPGRGWASLGGLLGLWTPPWRRSKPELVRWAGLTAGVAVMVAIPLILLGLQWGDNEDTREGLTPLAQALIEPATLDGPSPVERVSAPVQPAGASLEILLLEPNGSASAVAGDVSLAPVGGGKARMIELDDAGRATFERLEPGAWRVRVGQWSSPRFSVNEGANRETIQLPPLRPLLVNVEGLLGGPQASVMVDIWRAGEDRPVLLGRTDGEGKLSTHVTMTNAFLMARTEAGKWTGVVALNATERERVFSLVARDVAHHVIQFVDGRGTPLRDVEGVRGDGSIDRRQSPLEYQERVAKPAMGLWWGRIDSDGLMRLPKRLHMGRGKGDEPVLFQTPGEGRRLVYLPDEPTGELMTIQLGVGVVASGLVVGVDGSPVPAARVRIQMVDIPSAKFETSVVGNDGRFRFVGLAEGTYEIHAMHGDLMGSMVVDLSASPDGDLELVLNEKREHWLRVRVVDPGGQPLPNILVRTADLFVTRNPNNASDVTMAAMHRGWTDAEGWVQVDATLAYDSVRAVLVWASEGEDPSTKCGASTVHTLGGEFDPQVTLVLDPAQYCGLSGRFLPEARPESGSVIAWSRTLGYCLQTEVNSDSGAFAFTGLEPGEWSLLVGKTVISTHMLESSSQLDVGSIGSPKLGRVVIRLDPAMPGVHDSPIILSALRVGHDAVLGRTGDRTMPATLRKESAASLDLPGGEYVLAIRGKGVTSNRYRRISVEPGEELQLELGDFEIGNPLRCTILRVNSEAPQQIRVVVSSDGQVLQEFEAKDLFYSPYGLSLDEPKGRDLQIRILDLEGNEWTTDTIPKDWKPERGRGSIRLWLR
ncbi:MAG: sigma-70 family RNA polymerase sigma factor [Planctomycetota bacterium]|nr:sigma-70 family RNA polymerase sigma factor [Planctomycetota bacterium]